MQCTVIQESVYKAKEEIVVGDGRIYDLQALKSAEFKKRDANVFLICLFRTQTFYPKGTWGCGGK